MGQNSIIRHKSKLFAIDIVNLYKVLTEEKREFVMSKQLLRCGTSIGANVAEAEHAQSTADFYAKLKIAEKEAGETEYWLDILHSTEYIDTETFNEIYAKEQEIIRILVATCKTIATK